METARCAHDDGDWMVAGLERSGVAVFGGTFDPVHFGHLRSAVEVRRALDVQTVRLIPSYLPPHRGVPGSTAEHRLQMLRLATRGVDNIEVDDREIRREGKSFMIDTLRSIRDEIGDELPLTLVLGFDAFRLLDSWHQWQSLTDVAHIAVLQRPGEPVGEHADFPDENLSTELANFFGKRFVDRPLCLHSKPGGLMCVLQLIQLDISSTRIREIIGRGESLDYLTPTEVISYIREHRLYEAVS